MWFATWQFLAKRYQNASNIAWYEPASEPHLTHGTKQSHFQPCHSTTDITALFNEVISAIRAVDVATPIAMGGALTGYASCPGLTASDKLHDKNVIYNMNWPCHLGKADNVTYGGKVACSALGKILTQCIPECQNPTDDVNYDKKLVERLMQPVLNFQRKHKVPLWIDQLMCAPKAEHGAAEWLKDSFGILNDSIPNGFHFNWWTWKGDVASDPMSMSVLVSQEKSAKFDLEDYSVDEDVYAVYKQAFPEGYALYV